MKQSDSLLVALGQTFEEKDWDLDAWSYKQLYAARRWITRLIELKEAEDES